uniref:Uncharacterized protein n=1 Tax=Physcomitrium patens TaxID=3218 RepID=A0A7I4CPQ0_PHYPA
MCSVNGINFVDLGHCIEYCYVGGVCTGHTPGLGYVLMWHTNVSNWAFVVVVAAASAVAVAAQVQLYSGAGVTSFHEAPLRLLLLPSNGRCALSQPFSLLHSNPFPVLGPRGTPDPTVCLVAGLSLLTRIFSFPPLLPPIPPLGLRSRFQNTVAHKSDCSQLGKDGWSGAASNEVAQNFTHNITWPPNQRSDPDAFCRPPVAHPPYLRLSILKPFLGPLRCCNGCLVYTPSCAANLEFVQSRELRLRAAIAIVVLGSSSLIALPEERRLT